jgi:hypothetical protein
MVSNLNVSVGRIVKYQNLAIIKESGVILYSLSNNDFAKRCVRKV